VGHYLVTITPVPDGHTATSQVLQTSMRVEAGNGRAVIKALTMHMPESAKLVAGDLLAVDLQLLAQAFAVPTAENGSSPGPLTHPHAPLVASSGEGVVTTVDGAVASVARPAGATGRRERAYRRMPDPAELKAAYLETRSITGVAERYGVPTHTAQGWIGRLRRKGVIPTAS
jgi:hypothetical protein